MKQKQLSFFVLSLCLALIVGGFLFCARIGTQVFVYQQSIESGMKQLDQLLVLNKNNAPEVRSYHIRVAGDIMLDRGVEARLPSNLNEGEYISDWLPTGFVGDTSDGRDWLFPWKYIAQYTREADVFFANLEGSLSDVGSNGGKKYSFRFHPNARKGLLYAGVDVVSLANNHVWDWGKSSLCATPGNLAEVGIASIGAGCTKAEAEAPFITTLGNTKVAFLASTTFYQDAHATETRAGVMKLDLENIQNIIVDLKENQNVDLVFMSMHWGEEYFEKSTEAQQELGHALLDRGVDVVVGHHPHVIEEIEEAPNGWIIYSLGNFIFDQYFSPETMEGLMVDIEIRDKEVVSLTPMLMKLTREYQPYIEEF